MRSGIAPLVVALAACAGPKPTPLTAKGTKVTVLESSRDAAAETVVARCRPLGEVALRTRVNDGEQIRQSVATSGLNQLRNELARKGATHGVYTVVEQGTASPWINRYVFYEARAFDCGDAQITPSAPAPASQPPREAAPAPAPASAAPEPPGCSRDVDCKGDRICVDRVCVDPPKR